MTGAHAQAEELEIDLCDRIYSNVVGGPIDDGLLVGLSAGGHITLDVDCHAETERAAVHVVLEALMTAVPEAELLEIVTEPDT
ncbi:hypothetical protein Salmuc_01658 [Salipiger mucosus DSM 16094]|uniref:Uncharacterized protein n=1 Tax=Salipiger mucosus DSM 16094 TaxID=1123237 RepID=S9QW89_9RHOB|nr:hypothetical protein Salmuc_01658 [Salipiger mucosus DSM 16094]